MSTAVCPGRTIPEKFCLRAARLASLTIRVTYLPPLSLYRSGSQLFGKFQSVYSLWLTGVGIFILPFPFAKVPLSAGSLTIKVASPKAKLTPVVSYEIRSGNFPVCQLHSPNSLIPPRFPFFLLGVAHRALLRVRLHNITLSSTSLSSELFTGHCRMFDLGCLV